MLSLQGTSLFLNPINSTHRSYCLNVFQSDIVLMGDMNADCNIMSQAKRRATPLRHGNMYDGYIMYWLIQTGADTTTASSHCAYDRYTSLRERFRSHKILTLDQIIVESYLYFGQLF